jgi:hypothetical protein
MPFTSEEPLILKRLYHSYMKGADFLLLLRSLKSLEQYSASDNLTKSFWFKVRNSSCSVNAYLIHKDHASEMYRVRYHSKDPLDVEEGFLRNIISFEDFFEIIPEEVKEELIFHLDLFR